MREHLKPAVNETFLEVHQPSAAFLHQNTDTLSAIGLKIYVKRSEKLHIRLALVHQNLDILWAI